MSNKLGISKSPAYDKPTEPGFYWAKAPNGIHTRFEPVEVYYSGFFTPNEDGSLKLVVRLIGTDHEITVAKFNCIWGGRLEYS